MTGEAEATRALSEAEKTANVERPAIVIRPKQRMSSGIGRTTPSHRRLLQLEGLQQEISTV